MATLQENGYCRGHCRDKVTTGGIVGEGLLQVKGYCKGGIAGEWALQWHCRGRVIVEEGRLQRGHCRERGTVEGHCRGRVIAGEGILQGCIVGEGALQ